MAWLKAGGRHGTRQSVAVGHQMDLCDPSAAAPAYGVVVGFADRRPFLAVPGGVLVSPHDRGVHNTESNPPHGRSGGMEKPSTPSSAPKLRACCQPTARPTDPRHPRTLEGRRRPGGSVTPGRAPSSPPRSHAQTALPEAGLSNAARGRPPRSARSRHSAFASRDPVRCKESTQQDGHRSAGALR